MLVPPGSQLVLQQILRSDLASQAYSDPRFNDWLATGNDLRLFLIVDRVSGPPGSVNVEVEETADEDVGWIEMYGGIGGGGALSTTDISVFQFGDTEAARGRPSLGFRRLLGALEDLGSGTFSARLRVWASLRGGARRSNRLAFAERVEGTTAIYTPDAMSGPIAEADKLAICVLTEEVSGATTLTVQAEESPNGRVWHSVQGTPEINGINVASGDLNAFGISDVTPTGIYNFTEVLPPSGFVRFRIQLGGTSPAATVRLWVTGRDARAR